MIKKFLPLIFYVSSLVFCQSDIDNAAKYTLELSRNNIRAGEVTTLTVDLKLMKDYFVYSSQKLKLFFTFSQLFNENILWFVIPGHQTISILYSQLLISSKLLEYVSSVVEVIVTVVEVPPVAIS